MKDISSETLRFIACGSVDDGKSTLIEAIDKIKQNTRRYAKRQLTWLKKRKLIWVNKNIKIEELKNIILSSN